MRRGPAGPASPRAAAAAGGPDRGGDHAGGRSPEYRHWRRVTGPGGRGSGSRRRLPGQAGVSGRGRPPLVGGDESRTLCGSRSATRGGAASPAARAQRLRRRRRGVGPTPSAVPGPPGPLTTTSHTTARHEAPPANRRQETPRSMPEPPPRLGPEPRRRPRARLSRHREGRPAQQLDRRQPWWEPRCMSRRVQAMMATLDELPPAEREEVVAELRRRTACWHE